MDYEKYFISLNTGAGGLVSVKVMPPIESLDVMVQPGTHLKVNAHEFDPRNYVAYAEEVEIKR